MNSITKLILKYIFYSFFLIIVFNKASFCTIHKVQVGALGSVFTPNTQYVIVGDTVRFIHIGGNHTTTCDPGIDPNTSLPSGAATWDQPMNAGQIFDYKVTVAGVYNYECTIHSGSMTGIINAVSSTGGLIMYEPFSYDPGTLITTSGGNWGSYNTGNDPQSVSGSLSYTGLPPTNGNRLQYGGSNGKEAERLFTSVNSGKVYYSFILNVSTLNAANEYFIGLRGGGQTLYAAPVWYQQSGGNFLLGISGRSNTAPTYSGSLTGTVFVVASYEFVSGASNDIVKLWINPQLGLNTEPPPTVTLTNSGTDVTTIDGIFIRSANATSSVYEIDEIRTSNAWSDVALPVELISFNNVTINNNVKLNWSTSAEYNNKGFEIERAVYKSHNEGLSFKQIGFIEGKGNSTQLNNYSYNDFNLPSGIYKYRLKQVDYNGNYEFHYLTNDVIVGSSNKFELSQNYPNPFNPVTNIVYSLPSNGLVKLSVYDISGKEVAVLVNKIQFSGYYNVSLDGSNLSSGTYFYNLILNGENSNFQKTMKMILLK